MTRIGAILSIIYFVGCSTALPRGEGVIQTDVQEAENAATRARSSSAEARLQLEKAEKLVREMRVLLNRAEQAEHSCQEALKKSQRRKVIVSKPKAEQSVSTPEVTATVQPTAAPTEGKYPEFSQSDAPMPKNDGQKNEPKVEPAATPAK